jgi:hypothetical protein
LSRFATADPDGEERGDERRARAVSVADLLLRPRVLFWWLGGDMLRAVVSLRSDTAVVLPSRRADVCLKVRATERWG